MSLLDGLKRKKTKHVREQLLDAPTLFAGVGSDSAHAEKKISVLSAASGKPAGRTRQRRMPKRSWRLIRPLSIALLIGTIALAGVWQTGLFDRESAATLATKLDALLQAGVSAFSPSDTSSTHAVATQPSVSAPLATTRANSPGNEYVAQPASIERVAHANGTDAHISDQPVPAVGAIEAALNQTDPAAEATPAAVPARPEAKKPAVSATPVATPRASTARANAPASQQGSQAAGMPEQPAKDKPAPEKASERKVQVARSKEPDPDAQLMEALLLHLRKMESAKGGAR